MAVPFLCLSTILDLKRIKKFPNFVIFTPKISTEIIYNYILKFSLKIRKTFLQCNVVTAARKGEKLKGPSFQL